MNSFNWLHLTDLHFGLKGQPILWPSIQESFFKDLEKLHSKCGPWHAVLFSGDLVQSGADTEYDALDDKVIKPLWEKLNELGSNDAVLLTVPGNHDLVRPDNKKPKAALRQLTSEHRFIEIAEEFWEDPKSEYRELVNEAFENYQKWAAKNPYTKGLTITQGLLPGDFAATIEIGNQEKGKLKIGIAGLNTTFLQLTDDDFRERLVLDPAQLHQACGQNTPEWIKSHDACILMTHQGPDWLTKKALTEAYPEINGAGQFAVHLFGHMHQNLTRSIATGGGELLRQWQGSSLFGMMKFGRPPTTDRRHGYCAGSIEFDDEGATIQMWPRSAHKDANGWRFIQDNNACVIDEETWGTRPERLPSKNTPKRIQQGAKIEAKDSTGGTLCISTLQHHIQEMELRLQHALEAFKGQPTIFIEPKLSKKREFNDDPNELPLLIEDPKDAIVIAPPEFGLTCLGLYMQLQAFQKHRFWLYIDAEQTKGRKIVHLIEEQILHYGREAADLNCIVLDHWSPEVLDHQAIVKNIAASHPELPLIILAEDSLTLDVSGNLSKLKRNFQILHLQALSRSSMRKLVSGYNSSKQIGSVDIVLSGLAGHLEAINIHRTPLNCYTLLRVLDSNYNEKLLNKSKLLHAILFVLFTDKTSFSFLSEKPDVDECTYLLGCFCKDLVLKGDRYFDAASLSPKLVGICKQQRIPVNVDAMLEVLLENNILVRYGDQFAFRHRYWIFYFAAHWMCHDHDFKRHILNGRNYVNHPEIIEFYTGIDGSKSDAVEAILLDLNALITEVDQKIGIESSFDPLSLLLWNPTEQYIAQARTQIANKVESSNLPADFKDKQADDRYESAAPYDQSIRRFLTDYSVLCLWQSIKAASFALRSSPFVSTALKDKLTGAIFRGWEEVARIIFWLTPILAKDGRAIHDGFALMLAEGFSTDLDERFKQIIMANLENVSRLMGPDLCSKKIGPQIANYFEGGSSRLQKHMMILFLISVRPVGWYNIVLEYINLLHPRSYYLGNVMRGLNREIRLGDLEHSDEPSLKLLTRTIISKCDYAPKGSEDKQIPIEKVLHEENKLPIDQLLKGNQPEWRRD
jgi:hypothetical protein